VVEELCPVMARLGAPFEIVYCDDASSDGTAARLAAAQSRHPELCVVRHRDNWGKSVALASAVDAARGEWLVMLDGDGQNDPADIPRLVALIEAAGASPRLAMVAGIRRRRQDTWLKRASSRIANRVRSAVLKDRTPDTGCGLKLCRREAYRRLPRFDHNHRFLPALVQRDGGEVAFLEVTDRGPGVPREHMDRIFEPFFSGGQGTGLGLFLARELAQTNGATLLYEPRHGGGSIFRLVFADPRRWEVEH